MNRAFNEIRQYVQQAFDSFDIRPADSRFLIAVSGGMDSMALACFFHQEGWAIEIAHCNFQLRDADSDADEAFVQRFWESAGVPVHLTRFDTRELSRQRGESIQASARALRYEWLEVKRIERSCDWILTAHHQSDNVETVLLHLAKGAGIRGLRGIPFQQGHVFRPFLDVPKQLMEAFADREEVPYRTDLSNFSTKYTRNLIRLSWIPAMKQVNPGLEATIGQHILLYRDYEVMIRDLAGMLVPGFVFPEKHWIRLRLEVLRQKPYAATVLYEYLLPFGFQPANSREILDSSRSGALFDSDTHQVYLHGGDAFLVSRDFFQPREYSWESGDATLRIGEDWELVLSPEEPVDRQGFQVSVRRSSLQFPLIVRKWKDGDRFYPSGRILQQQKLKKFFTNLHLSIPEKQSVWILCNGNGDIISLLGMRNDQRYQAMAEEADTWILANPI